METIHEYVERCRVWQQANPDWELVCDIEDCDPLYIQWSELPKAERMSWIGSYRSSARDAFEEFGIKRCKVEKKVLNSGLELCDKWPQGHAMRVFRTKVDGVGII